MLLYLWHFGYWARDQRRYYHTLRAIQILKRQIVCDKLTLCWQAVRSSTLIKTDPLVLSEADPLFAQDDVEQGEMGEAAEGVWLRCDWL
jgi:hypothetical protein